MKPSLDLAYNAVMELRYELKKERSGGIVPSLFSAERYGNYMFYSKEIIDWAVNKAKRDYPEDIAVILADRFANKTPGDGDCTALQFFVPATEKGFEAAMTFMVEGIGYDYFPISWERLEKIADLKDNLCFVLAEAQVVYAKSPGDEARFESLRKKLFTHLADRNYSYRIAEDKLKSVMDIYKNMVFEESPCALRKAAAWVNVLLAETIAAVNGDYVNRGFIGSSYPLPYLETVSDLPEGYIKLSENVLEAEPEKLSDICRRLIVMVRKYLEEGMPETEREQADPSELAGWFEESAYTWRRIDYFCSVGDAGNAMTSGAYLQTELDIIGEKYELGDVDMLMSFDKNDLGAFNERAQLVMRNVRDRFEKLGVSIRDYGSLEDFLKAEG